jgi:hypothetical protein
MNGHSGTGKAKPRKPLTPKAATMRKEMVERRLAAQQNGMRLVNALHDAGFRRLLVRTQQITPDSSYVFCIVVEELELNFDRLADVLVTSAMHDAKVDLREGRINIYPEHE